MEFSLLNMASWGSGKRHRHWWLSFCDLEMTWHQFAVFHIEYDSGVWKFDFFGLRALVYWLRDRRENKE